MTVDRLSRFVFEESIPTPEPDHPFILGAIPGEGVGPEVIQSALKVLSALESLGPFQFDIRYGGPIGLEAEKHHGKVLSDEAIAFHEDIFGKGGAVLTGPGGGRYVYDLRRRFDLFALRIII